MALPSSISIPRFTAAQPASRPTIVSGDLAGASESSLFAHYVNLRSFVHYVESIPASSTNPEEIKLRDDYAARGKAHIGEQITAYRDAYISAYAQSHNITADKAREAVALIDGAISAQLASRPELARDPKKLVAEINASFGLGYTPTDLDAAEEERQRKQAQVNKQIAEELAGARASGDSIFRVFGGIGVPSDVGTKSLSEADAMGAAKGFLAKAQADGLIRLSPAQLEEQQAILGVISKVALEQTSIRSVINMGVHTVAEGAPEVVQAFLKGGGELTPQNLENFIKTTDAWKDLAADAKQAAMSFAEQMGEGAGRVNYKVTSQERVRITSEIWQLMVNPSNAQYMGYGGAIKKEYLEQLPESVRSKLGENPTMYDLASLLDPSIRPLATMYTGAQAHAPAQNYQQTYTMSYHDTSIWGVMGGVPAQHMLKYARADVNSQPDKAFVVGEREPSPDQQQPDPGKAARAHAAREERFREFGA